MTAMETGVADDEGWITVGPDGEPITDTVNTNIWHIVDDKMKQQPFNLKLHGKSRNQTIVID